jgi:O-acetyl-ADP-ribose deacetylase
MEAHGRFAMSSTLKSRLESIEADITTLPSDAIVNAANEPLIMGAGVDGAIRRRAGPEMEAELRRIGRCPTGTSIITSAYRLPAKYVIHTVAPVWSGNAGDEVLLASCYRSALSLAAAEGLATVAFPCIGTGIYGWPSDKAAEIAFASVIKHIGQNASPGKVAFCCFSSVDRARYQAMIETFESSQGISFRNG